MGPPLSPLQESFPEAAAQNMLSVIAEVPYSDRQVARDTTGTETYLKEAGRVEPLSEVSPLLIVSFLSCSRSVWVNLGESRARKDLPAGHGGANTSGWVRALRWESRIANISTRGYRSGQFPEGNIVVDGILVVAGMDNDLRNTDKSTTGRVFLINDESESPKVIFQGF